MRAIWGGTALNISLYAEDKKSSISCVIEEKTTKLVVNVVDEVNNKNNIFPVEGLFIQQTPENVVIREANSITVFISSKLFNSIISNTKDAFMCRTYFDRLHIKYVEFE